MGQEVWDSSGDAPHSESALVPALLWEAVVAEMIFIGRTQMNPGSPALSILIILGVNSRTSADPKTTHCFSGFSQLRTFSIDEQRPPD